MLPPQDGWRCCRRTLLRGARSHPALAGEPTKWAQVLRATVPNGDEVLLKMDLAAGHFSASDRYKYLKELSFDYAWLLDQLGKAEACTPTAGGATEYEPAQAVY